MMARFVLFLFSMVLVQGVCLSQDRLSETFFHYETFTLEPQRVVEASKEGFFTLDFQVPGQNRTLELDLRVSNIIADNYKVRYATDAGIRQRIGTTAVPTQGYIVGQPDSRVSLTFNADFMYGFIMEGGEYYYIEPLEYFSKEAERNTFLFYSASDLKPTAEKTCGNQHRHGHQLNEETIKDVKDQGSRMGECYEVEYAIANDFLMFQSYGSVTGVENHAVGVTNNVQTNYDDEFADELQFVIVEQFVVTSAAQDPWSSTTNAGAFLDDFTDWGPTGFGSTHDVASCWTDRDFNGGTIGVAWLNAVCTSLRYNVLQDFTNNSQTKRVLVAHELGHNFDAVHDGSNSGFIMAPSVNTSTTWSSNSISDVNSHVASRWCLDDCVGSGPTPPVADFSFSVFGDCAPVEVEFLDASTGTVDTYFWEFPGGTPATSSAENPFVIYNESGSYDVSLTVTNSAGSDTYTETNTIVVEGVPDPNFSFSINESTVTFTNLTFGGTNVQWNFGDGFTSTEQDPVHTYLNDGNYTVILTVFDDCGAGEQIELVTIATEPVASFGSDNPSGCAVHTVNFFSTSSANTESFLWTFEGGEPATSTEEEPVVTYSSAGDFDVTLTVSNPQGDNTNMQQDHVTIDPMAIASFIFTTDNNVVSFDNTSTGTSTYSWDFGDGNTSTEESPIHTYAAEGTYSVTLTAEGVCDPVSFTQEVSITLLPVANFATNNGITAGCTPFSVTFEDMTSNNPTSWSWVFEGGTPATSTEQNPTVIYEAAGSFDVQLTATNALGTDVLMITDYISVDSGPNAAIDFTADELSIDFVSNAQNAMEILWDFGDGSTSSDIDPTHTYTAEGEYTVTLTVTNMCGSETYTAVVAAYQQVSADFTPSVTAICAGGAVSYTNTSSVNATSFVWTFEGGSPATSTEENPTITYASAGTYSVTLLASNALYEDEILYSDIITVSSPLDVSISSSANGAAVTFEAVGSAGADSYAWDFGDGNTSTESSPTHTYTTEGFFDVTVAVTSVCGVYTAMETISIFSPVTASYSSSSNGGCAPHIITYTNESTANATAYQWTFEGGNPAASTEASPVVTYTTAGTYAVTLVASNPESESTANSTVTITDVPEVSFDYFREMLEISFTSNSTAGDSYAWDFGDDNTSTEENPTHTYAVEGSYEVTLTVTNACGSSSDTKTVEANALPTAAFTVAAATEGCVPFVVNYVDASSSNVTGWSWTFEGGSPATSTEANPTVTYNEAGTYDVGLVVTAEAGSDGTERVDFITVGDVPVAVFDVEISGSDVVLTFTGENADEVSWDFGDGRTSTERSPMVTFEMDGTYTIIMTATNGCGTVTAQQEIIVNTVSVEDVGGLLFDVYPNPARDQVTVVADVEKAQLSIIDMSGRVVQRQAAGQQTLVNTSGLPNGAYMMQMVHEGQVAYKKLVILK